MASATHSVRLIQFTDTHLMGDPQARLRDIATTHSFDACLRRARQRHLPADALLVTGDVVHDDPAGYGVLELLLEPLATPTLVIAGNHDLPQAMRRRLAQAPFQTDGVYACGRWRLLLLESWFADSADGEGRLGAAQLAELGLLLRAHADAHLLLCLHHPPMAMDTPGLDELRLEDGAELLQLLAGLPQVKGVLWGHAHQALDVLRDGVRYMCTPSTCFQFATRAGFFRTDDRPPGYRLLDLHPDGGITTEIAWLDDYDR